jgi:subtilisin-like proprotein convertase family protein
MTTKLRLVLSITMLFASFYAVGQTGYWRPAEVEDALLSPDIKRLERQKVRFYTLEDSSLGNELNRLTSREANSTLVYFPSPTGNLEPYTVKETPVFSPELTARYPQIRSYSGTAVNDKDKRVRFSVSHKGVEAMFINPGGEQKWFIQRVSPREKDYVLYSRKDDPGEASKFLCYTEDKRSEVAGAMAAKLVDDQLLRRYRIAVSATGEYTQFHGGTVSDALAAINATLTRVNEVFLTDLGITLELVANNDLVIFTDPETDPYQTNLNSEVQNTLNNVIGNPNYDVGHLFHEDTDGGNAGFIGAVCRTNQKGSAYSASRNPQGDIFDLDYVSHELGHQFGANHTWSFDSEGTGVQAEPASGSTIMGYAGIVQGNNVQNDGDDYFHYYSVFQISAYVVTTTCAEEIDITNSPPVVTASADFVIPRGTAFVLSGTATDPDPGDVLTYAWEQIDDGVVTSSTFGPGNPRGANFRSLPPTISPDRYFPRLSRVVAGQLTQTNPTVNSAWETVSNIERELNFALTVRDNAPTGGQVASDLVNVRVTNAAGPFTVLSQSTPQTYGAGSQQTVNWDVAQTNSPPVDAQFVEILLSLDGGVTFPVVLADKAPNDGSHVVLLPGNATNQARIMVKGWNNIFFAVNGANITIEESPVVLQFEALAFDICQPSDQVIPFVYETYGGFSEEVTFSVEGLPAGLGATFVPGTATTNGTPVDLTITNTTAVTEGAYPVRVVASAPSFTQEVDIVLHVFDTDFPEVSLLSPANLAAGVPLRPALSWDTPAINNAYELQIATNASFTNVVQTATVIAKSYTAETLLPETTYFWRVKPVTNCGEGVFGGANSFTTIPVNCRIRNASDLPLTISSTGTPTVISTIQINDDLPVADVNVRLNIDHSFLSDLIISLISPSGTEVVLTSNSCSQFENIDAVFDDDSSPFVCGVNPAISGVVRPLGSLASFHGESAFGEWTLLVRDTAPADGGVINTFELDICVEGILRPDADNDGVFDDGDDLCLGTPPNTEVNTDGCPVYRFEQDNFNIELVSESCISSNDGEIRITANASLDYTVSISGNGVNETADFTGTYQLVSLSAGTYTACISGTDGIITYEDYCLDFVISEPDPLSVLIALDQDALQATLTLGGSQLYNVELNGILSQTTQSEFALNLKAGVNTVRVTGALPCQGVFEEVILIGDEPVIYPNPFEAELQVFLPPASSPVQVRVFNLLGQEVYAGEFIPEEQIISVDLGSLPSGVYLMRISGDAVNFSTKAIKR